MKSIKEEQNFSFNNNNQSNDEINSRETILFMQNHRNTYNWYSDSLSSTIVIIIERYEQINERLHKTSIADILAEIKLDNNSRDNACLKEENVGRNPSTNGYVFNMYAIDFVSLFQITKYHYYLKIHFVCTSAVPGNVHNAFV